jgi:hypothetical protein
MIPMPDSRKIVAISRRNVLRNATAAAGGGVIFAATIIVDQAKAADKISKDAAAYQALPRNGAQCDICVLFQPPISCSLVDGPISTRGWCRYFTPRV